MQHKFVASALSLFSIFPFQTSVHSLSRPPQLRTSKRGVSLEFRKLCFSGSKGSSSQKPRCQDPLAVRIAQQSHLRSSEHKTRSSKSDHNFSHGLSRFECKYTPSSYAQAARLICFANTSCPMGLAIDSRSRCSSGSHFFLNKQFHDEASDVLSSQVMLQLHRDQSLYYPFPEWPLRVFAKPTRFSTRKVG